MKIKYSLLEFLGFILACILGCIVIYLFKRNDIAYMGTVQYGWRP